MKLYRKASFDDLARFVYHSGAECDMSPDHARLLKAHGLGDFKIKTRIHAHFPERQTFDLAHDHSLIDALRAVVHAPLNYIMEIRPPGKNTTKRRQDQRAALDALLNTVSRERTHYGRRYPPPVWEQLFLREFGRTHPDQVLHFRHSVRTLCGMGIVHLTPHLRTDDDFVHLVNAIHQWLLDNPPAPAIVGAPRLPQQTTGVVSCEQGHE